MVSIKICNVTDREAGLPLVHALGGKSYMKIEISLAPARGSFNVMASTNRADTTEEQLREMVMLLLCGAVRDLGQDAVLRAIAVGCDRLSDGDPRDVREAAVVDAIVLKNLGRRRRGLGHEKPEAGSP